MVRPSNLSNSITVCKSLSISGTSLKSLECTYTIQNSSRHAGAVPSSLEHVGPVYNNSPRKSHRYYQWVPFFLFFLALGFYAPHYIWKILEKETLKRILSGMELLAYTCVDIQISSIPSLKQRDDKIQEIADYMWQRIKYRLNLRWSAMLIFSELLTLGYSILALWLTGVFLGEDWVILKMHTANVSAVFPTLVKCEFVMYGPSGSIQNHDALCLIAQNFMNGKIFYFLRFWLPMMVLVSFLAIAWRIFCFCCYGSVHFNSLFSFGYLGIDKDNWRLVLRKITYCDWIFMCYLASNSDSFVYKEMLAGLAEHIKCETGLQGNHNKAYDTTSTMPADQPPDPTKQKPENNTSMGFQFELSERNDARNRHSPAIAERYNNENRRTGKVLSNRNMTVGKPNKRWFF